MLEEPTLTLSELLDQAAAAARLGDQAEAEQLYRRATQRSPANTRAWLGLAGAVKDFEEKRACFEQVLAVDPNNGEARAALRRLAERAGGQPASEIEALLQESAARATATQPVQPSPPSPAARQEQHDDHESVPANTGEVLYCVNHPDTETTLRCNRCGRPVCVRCVELTEVGYRCKDCIRQQQSVFFTAAATDYIILVVVSFLLAAIATPIIGYVLRFLGFFGWLLAFLLGPTVGGAAATIIRRSIGRRRGRYMGVVAAVAILLGTLIGLAAGALFDLLPNLLALGIFVFLALSTITASLR